MGKFYFSDLENQLLRNETKQKLVPSEFEHWGGGSICLSWPKSNLASEPKCSNLRSNLKIFMIAIPFVQ